MSDLEFFSKSIIFYKRRNFQGKFCGTDSPNNGYVDENWFENYPVQDFDYKFNSWGFRGDDYRQYIEKPVVLCLGDSITANIGGPIGHSWPSLLQEHFDIPCLNFGMEYAGNDAMRLIYDAACKIFNVKHTFVVYGFFHRRLEKGIFRSDYYEHEENVQYFLQNWIPNSCFQFSPPTSYSSEEQQFANSFVDPYLSLTDVYWSKEIDRKLVSRKNYNTYAGSSWPSYDEFLRGAAPHKDLYEKCKLETNLFKGRDGVHLNLNGNRLIVNSLLKQFKEKTK